MSLPLTLRSFQNRIALVSIAAAFVVSSTVSAAPLSFVHGKGSIVVDDAGKQLTLRGCNLGNWLIIESWMVGFASDDQESLIKTFRDRFGAADADRLMNLYRDGYIQPRDFEVIKSFGFNLVRVPFDSRMLIDEHGTMRPDAFKWLDRALEMAEQAGVYVILDMHGGPGSQSIQDHTGQSGQNKLWSEPVDQTRMAELWKRIADRYKDRSVVAAYDVLNEPYGDFHADMRPNLKALMPRCYTAIRSTGDKHLVIFPNALGAGVTFYDDPKAAGMEQVAFTDHYYAGLFGSPSTVKSHAGMFMRTMPEEQTFLDRVGSPMLIGEFNVVLEKAGGKPMMRRYFDEFAHRGWMATMWSYKSLKPAAGVQSDNWYMATNADALPAIDMKRSSLQEIESYLNQLATMPLAVDERLRTALTAPVAPPMTLPTLDVLPAAAPPARASGDWKLVDVNAALPGGVSASGSKIALFSTGSDIFGSKDSFSFLQQPAPEKAVLTATVDHLSDSDQWAKCGVMLRFGDGAATDSSAPFVMVNTFVDGGVAFVVRDRAGATATESKRSIGPLPRRVALVRDGTHIDGYVDNGSQGWVKLGSITMPSGAARIGLVACSHRDHLFTQADFTNVSLEKNAVFSGVTPTATATVDASAPNLLKNASFDKVGSDARAPADWNRWGDRFNIETSTGGGLTWSGHGSAGTDGVWQDIQVDPGQSYAFAIRVHRDDTSSKGPSLLVSIESTVDGNQVALAERAIEVNQLEASGGWSVVRIDAAAISDRMRVIVRVDSAAGVSASDLTIGNAAFSKINP